MWIRPSPCEWMPTWTSLSTLLWNSGAGLSHWPHTFTSSEACQWSPASPVASLPGRGAAYADSRRPATVHTSKAMPTTATSPIPMFQPNDPPRRPGVAVTGLRQLFPCRSRSSCFASAVGKAVAAAMPRLPGHLWRPRSAAQGMVGHGELCPQREEHRRRRQREATGPAPALRREPVERPVVLGDHAVGVLRRRRTLHVRDDRPRLVRDAPAVLPELPAEIDVLDVHEIPLVPSADGRQGLAPQPDCGPGDPVDVARAVRVGIQLPVATGERIRAPEEPEEPVPDRVPHPRNRTRRRVDGGVGVADHRTDGAEVGLRPEPPQQCGGGSFGDLEIRVADGDDRRVGGLDAEVRRTRVAEI